MTRQISNVPGTYKIEKDKYELYYAVTLQSKVNFIKTVFINGDYGV